MPRTTVYIRNEDWDAWKALENKSQAISTFLNAEKWGDKETREVRMLKLNKPIIGLSPKPIEGMREREVVAPKGTKLCKKHDMDPELCRFMKH